METMLVIIGLFLCASVVLAIAANIFYVASQGLADLSETLGNILRFIRRG